MKNSKNSFQVLNLKTRHSSNHLFDSDLVQEIKENIIEHKTKLESTLAKKGEKKTGETTKEATNAENNAATPNPAANGGGGASNGGSLMTTILILFFALLAGIIFSKES